jgi:hypothetical protein
MAARQSVTPGSVTTPLYLASAVSTQLLHNVNLADSSGMTADHFLSWIFSQTGRIQMTSLSRTIPAIKQSTWHSPGIQAYKVTGVEQSNVATVFDHRKTGGNVHMAQNDTAETGSIP